MNYAKIENGQIVRIAPISQLLPNVSFTDLGPDPEFLLTLDILPVEEITTYDAEEYRVEPITPTIDGQTVKTYQLVALTQEEKDNLAANRLEAAWSVVRQIRDQRLAESDWTQLPDVTTDDPQAWLDYRQALRDITTQNDPNNIIWPTSPDQS